jgi:hypothetical protein
MYLLFVWTDFNIINKQLVKKSTIPLKGVSIYLEKWNSSLNKDKVKILTRADGL